ncbi:class III lanthipeptide [Streptomyces exfoliatus]|uniref:Class III lanthipeptide n=1 Tax=Streptomyces exfoliatus TaxID=1905 RepID=A0ABV3D626_STREX
MAVLKLQMIKPTAVTSGAAVISVTSSSSTCCTTDPV